MPVTNIIHATAAGSGSPTSVYQVPSAQWAFITSINVTNTDTVSHTFTVYTQPSGGSSVAYGGNTVSLAGGQTMEICPDPESLRLPSLSQILFKSSDASVVITVSGEGGTF